jgi:hypothetical protein
VVEPAILLLGPGEKDRSRLLRLQNGDVQPFQITKVYNRTPSLHYELDSKRSEMPYVRYVRVGFGRETPTEPIETEIVLKTDIKGAEEIKVPVIYKP